MGIPPMMNLRSQKIKDVEDKLEALAQKKPIWSEEIKILLSFFKSTKNIFSYFCWLIKIAPKLDPDKILEINDLNNPEWEEIMYQNLIRVERSKLIALVEPLVESIYKKITEQDKKLILASLGSGSMEIEKQVLEKVISKNLRNQPCLFIGIDISPTAKKMSKDNLSKLGESIEIIEKNNIDYNFLLNTFTSLKKHTVILATNNIFDLEKEFPVKSIDIIYSCLFRHHLDRGQKDNLSKLYIDWANCVLEYDGFKSWLNMIPQTFAGWKEPVFLNSEIFSNLRFIKKKEIKKIIPNGIVRYFNNGYYLLEYNHESSK